MLIWYTPTNYGHKTMDACPLLQNSCMQNNHVHLQTRSGTKCGAPAASRGCTIKRTAAWPATHTRCSCARLMLLHPFACATNAETLYELPNNLQNLLLGVRPTNSLTASSQACYRCHCQKVSLLHCWGQLQLVGSLSAACCCPCRVRCSACCCTSSAAVRRIMRPVAMGLSKMLGAPAAQQEQKHRTNGCCSTAARVNYMLPPR